MAPVRGKGLEGWAIGGAVTRSLNVVFLEGEEGEWMVVESEACEGGEERRE